jgi:hypothetical protein
MGVERTAAPWKVFKFEDSNSFLEEPVVRRTLKIGISLRQFGYNPASALLAATSTLQLQRPTSWSASSPSGILTRPSPSGGFSVSGAPRWHLHVTYPRMASSRHLPKDGIYSTSNPVLIGAELILVSGGLVLRPGCGIHSSSASLNRL